MKRTKIVKGITVYALVLLLTVPFTVLSDQVQVSAAEDSQVAFSPEELEQMLAPVALYPDALLAQVLTAATYPLEVVEAARFVKKNPGLKGDVLLEAAKDKDWEPSVKAMLGFPDLLAMMDEQLEWTQTLGEAFLLQQQDCMDTVQRLRQRAYAQGNLTTTPQQVITVDPQTQIIIIKPANTKIVYVPVYDPTIIYGAWWYPAYPPYYFYPHRYFGIRFFSGIFVGLYWGTWGCNWHHHHVYVNVNHYRTFTKTYYHRAGYDRFYKAVQIEQPWRFDSRRRHRSGYRRTSLTVSPSVSVSRAYQQTSVRKATTAAKETLRPTGISSTQRTMIQSNLSKLPVVKGKVESTPIAKTSKQLTTVKAKVNSVPAVASNRVLNRKSTNIRAKVNPITNIEKQESTAIPKTNYSAKVAGTPVLETKTKVNSKIGKKATQAREVKPAKAISHNKFKTKDVNPEGIGKGPREQLDLKHQVPDAVRGSRGLPEGLISSFSR